MSAVTHPTPRRCPECGSWASIRLGLCEVCLMEFGEYGGPAIPDERATSPKLSDLVEDLRSVIDRLWRLEMDAAAGRRRIQASGRLLGAALLEDESSPL